VALAFRQPGQIDALLATISAQLSPEQQQGLNAITYREGNDIVVFGSNPNMSQSVAAALAQGPEGLGLSPRSGAFLTGHIDVAAILDQATASGDLMPDERQGLSDAGLANVSAVDFTGRFEGEGLAGEATVSFDGPRTGVASFLGPDRQFGFVGLAPASTLLALGLAMAPPSEILSWVEQRVQIDPDPMARQNFEAGLAEFQTETGLDLRTQVLPAFGQEIALVVGGATGMSADAALLLEVRDQATIQQLIDTLIEKANTEAAAGLPPGQPAPPPIVTAMPMTEGSVSYTALTIQGLPMQLCYAFLGDHLVVATSQNEMRAIAQVRSGAGGLAQAPGFTEAAGALAPQASLMSYSDNRALVTTLSGALVPLLMMSGAADPQMQTLLMQLPALAQHMGVKAGTISAEPDQLTLRGHNTSGAEAIAVLMLAVTALDSRAMDTPPGS
jgi:hypothetical protein